MKRIFILLNLFLGLGWIASRASAQSAQVVTPQVFILEEQRVQSAMPSCDPTLQLTPATAEQRRTAIQLMQAGLVPVYEGQILVGEAAQQRTQSVEEILGEDVVCLPASSFNQLNFGQGGMFYNNGNNPYYNIYPQLYGYTR